MDIRGLGPQTLQKMLDLGLIRGAADLYDLTPEQVSTLPGFKEKLVENLVSSIEQSKARPFARVLFALGIRHVGESIAGLIASGLGNIDAIQAASEEEISAIPGIGPEIARSVRNFFAVDIVDGRQAAIDDFHFFRIDIEADDVEARYDLDGKRSELATVLLRSTSGSM